MAASASSLALSFFLGLQTTLLPPSVSFKLHFDSVSVSVFASSASKWNWLLGSYVMLRFRLTLRTSKMLRWLRMVQPSQPLQLQITTTSSSSPDLVQMGFSDAMFANLVEMGYPVELIARAIEENGNAGEENEEQILNALLSCGEEEEFSVVKEEDDFGLNEEDHLD